ncbi:MAG TPA: tetratricopeptide repeat protein [Lysobacter sp.]|nr:tetratricopeptide repeat protein [Lysobacter sp.]
MTMLRPLLLAALLLAPSFASAQSLPRPAEFYFDPDAGAHRSIEVVRERGDAAVQRLLKTIERKPDDAAAERIQLAHLAMTEGRTELGRRLYAEAHARIDRSHAFWRALVWRHGWDLYRAGDAQGALEQWRVLAQGRIHGAWMPPTFALALWTLGRRDEALQWYAAAVRTEPERWSTPAGFAELLPDWREEERARLAEVQQAWAANPPAWP